MKNHADRLGIPATTHDFRHAKASVMLNRGANMSGVQEIFRHESISTTSTIFARCDVRHRREAFDRYSAPVEEAVAELG